MVTQAVVDDRAGDDQLLPVTRWMGYLIQPVLLAAFVILFVFPGRTADLWAWPIAPPVTAAMMGASYLAGAYFFTRVARADRWHTIGRGFPAVTAFTSLLLLATVLHWDRFDHGHVSFWAWLALYVVTPPLLPLVWWRNRLRDPGTPDSPTDLVSPVLRTVTATTGALLLLLVVVAFVRPSLAIDVWPWPLTPLTARVLAAFASFPAVSLLTFAWESRWSALARLVEATALGLALTTVAVVLRIGDLSTTTAGTAAYLAVLVGSVLLLTALHRNQRRA